MKTLFRLFLFVFFIGNLNSLSAQDTTLVKPKELHYTSDFEKQYFEEFFKTGKPNLLALSVSLNELTTQFEYNKIKGAIDLLIAESDSKVKDEKDIYKKVKFIFEKVHTKLFKKYDINSHFDKIFSDGIYNCVTGSMLYGFIFDHYGIPYKIMEKPQHVYLIADPDNKRILVESTDPTSGYFLPSEKYKKEFVDYLVKSKTVSKDELNNQGYDSIFNKNTYADEKINFQQLVALQYYNSTLEFVNKKDYQSSLNQIQKAYVLYPCEKIKYVLTLCYPLLLTDKDFSNLDDIDLYIRYFNLSDDDKSVFVEEFHNMTQKFLVNENKREHYDKIFNKINTSIRDSAFLNKIYLNYYGEYARLEYNNGEYKKALDHMLLAYSRNTDNALAKSFLASIIAEQIRTSNDYKKNIANLDVQVAKYPFLKENPYINAAYGNCYLLMVGSSFEANNEKQALSYLKSFEAIAENKDVQCNDNIIGYAYSAAWGYYVRMQKRAYAMQFITRGLKYAPYNSDLQHKKRIADEDPAK
jgi:hypothetical protein